jgi:LemA protein
VVLTLILYAALVLAVVGIGLYLVGSYNQMVHCAKEIERAFANIEVSLKQRHDEIPRLVEVCRGYIEHEKTVLQEVTMARGRFQESRSVDEKVVAENNLSSGLVRIFALSEKYSDLKANDLFRQLSTRLTEIEDQIADRRELFNAAVMAHNTYIERFPAVVWAKTLRFKSRPMLELGARDQAPPSTFGLRNAFSSRRRPWLPYRLSFS